jgi:hypothetical protein
MISHFDEERRMGGVPHAGNVREFTTRPIPKPTRGGFELSKRSMKASILRLTTKAQRLGRNEIQQLAQKSAQLGLSEIPIKSTLTESFATQFATAKL